MPRHIVLLRGINLGPRNRISMPELREALGAAGYGDVRTHLQSGNVVVSSDEAPDDLARSCERLIADAFGLDIGVVVRTRDALEQIVARNPLGDVADNPKLYQVTFLDREPDTATVEKLTALAAGGERLVADGRELYTWHPDGFGRSKLGARLSRAAPVATTRNWATVTALLELAAHDEPGAGEGR